MVRARRAKPRPGRVVVPVVLALLAVAAVVSVQRGWLGDGTSGAAVPPAVATSPAAGAGPDPTDPTPDGTSSDASSGPSGPSATPSATSTASSSASSSSAAVGGQQLADCRLRVRAADRVVGAAEVGVGHWEEHVDAQTDAYAGRVTREGMEATFKRTRLAGPADVTRYEGAVERYRQQSASCRGTGSTPAAVGTRLAACRQRESAQGPVLAAARDAMDDWESHLAAMRRSRMGHVHDAQGIWIRTWRAAPPHLRAFDQAANRLGDAPSC